MGKKRSGGVNKSAMVREFLASTPKMSVKEIVGAMSARGVEVKPQLVYLIKSKEHAKSRKAKRQKVAATATSNGISNPVELIRAVRQLAEQAGGMGQLKALVDILAE